MTSTKIAELQGELTAIVEAILSVKATLQQGVPNADLACSRHDGIGKNLVAFYERLKELLLQLGLVEERSGPAASSTGEPPITIDGSGILFLCCRNAVLDTIESLESVFLDAVSTGGPVETKHYKQINPSLPAKALEGIERKIEKTFIDIKNKAGRKHQVVIVTEAGNGTDALLASSRGLIEKRLGVDVRVLELPSLDVPEREFITLLSKVISK